MKNLLSFAEFTNDSVNESNKNNEILLNLIIESEISDRLTSGDFDLDRESIDELDYLSEHLEDFYAELGENPYMIFENDEDIEAAKKEGARSNTKKAVNAYGWLIFPYISLYRAVYKTIAKKMAIKKILKKETDPAKKAKLSAQLKELTRAQVEAYKKIQDAKEKGKEKKEQIEDSGKLKNVPAEKKEALIQKAEKTKEDVKAVQQEIEKVKEKGKTK